MRKHLMAIALAILPATALLAQDRPPVSVGMTDYLAPPTSLEAFWQDVPLVAIVKVKNIQQKSMARGRPLPFLNSDVDVVEVLKDNGASRAHQVNAIAILGGTIVHDNRQISERDDSFPELKTEHRFLVFLKWWPAAEAYTPAYGPAGIFDIEGDTVSIPGSARGIKEFQNRKSVPKSELLAALRDLKDKGK